MALVCGDLHPGAFLHGSWMQFLHILSHDQVRWAADTFKIEFDSVYTWHASICITIQCQ